MPARGIPIGVNLSRPSRTTTWRDWSSHVILSVAKDLSVRRVRSFATLRMTRLDITFTPMGVSLPYAKRLTRLVYGRGYLPPRQSSPCGVVNEPSLQSDQKQSACQGLACQRKHDHQVEHTGGRLE